MNDDLERFKKRKTRHAKANLECEGAYSVFKVPSPNTTLPAMVPQTEIPPDYRSSEAIPSDPDALLAQIHQKIDAEKIDALFDTLKREALQVVIRQFGLGSVLFEDKLGGNVTTTHNFKKGITATNGDKERYDNWQDRSEKNINEKRIPYLKDYKKKRDNDFKEESPKIIDGYTGENLEKDRFTHWEHITPVSKIDADAGLNLRMTEEERVKLANSDENKVYTKFEINQSKGDKDLIQWYESLSPEDRANLKLDKRLIDAAYKKSTKKIKQEETKAWIKKDGVEIVHTSALEAGKMGLQQALGVLIEEFVRAVFDEVKDIWQNGFKGKIDDTFLAVLKVRLVRVRDRVLLRWKDAVQAFKDGAISGMFSNIITVLINMFATTLKNVVRMIREGVMVLYRALKALFSPPEGQSWAEAADAAVKILVAGGVMIGGMALEEYLRLHLLPFLGPLTDYVVPIVVGLATGVTTACTVYMLDKIDLFGVQAAARHQRVMARLTEIITISDENINTSFLRMNQSIRAISQHCADIKDLIAGPVLLHHPHYIDQKPIYDSKPSVEELPRPLLLTSDTQKKD